VDQDEAYIKGTSRAKWPESKHNHQPSTAVDVAPYPLNWFNRPRFYWFAGYVMGIAQKLKDEGKMTHSVRFGGDWDGDRDIDDNALSDLVHFELID
jgi:peptidoglycan L-alanyl-D-glutamate endopeptidase CwlK